MTNKPLKCQGCPFEKTGKGFLRPDLSHQSPILLVGEHPSSDDLRGIKYAGYNADGQPQLETVTPRPFLGYRGYKLKQLGYEKVNQDYLIRCQPPYKYPGWQLEKAALHCNHAYREEPPETKLILAMGDLAWDGYLHQWTREQRLPLTEWRGFLAPRNPVTKTPVYGVNDLQACSYDKVERYLTNHDWARIPAILEGSWPIPEPTEVIHVTKSTPHDRIQHFFTRYLESGRTPLVIDTEYTIKDRFLRLFGCGYHTERGEEYYLQMYWSNSQNPDAPRKVVVDWLFDLAYDPAVKNLHQGFLLQNAAADWPILDYNWRAYGKWGWPMNYHDTMLMHAKVESEFPHSLQFLESIYSRRAKKKHLASTEELTYHLGDLSTTLDCWVGLKAEMTPGMWDVYTTQDLKVFPLVQWSKQNGIRVDHTKVKPLYEKLQVYMEHAVSIAQTYCGKGHYFNLNSDTQMKEWLYDHERMEPVKSRQTGKMTINGDALLKLRQRYAKEENGWEVLEGDEIWNPEVLEQRIEEGGCHPLLEAKAAFNYYEDKVAKYIRTQLFDKHGTKKYRVYPSISIHAQATGRHSTTDPPLAQWPDELQDLLTPDRGMMWLGGDFRGQEVWIYSCLINDEKTLDALLNGYDTHTIAMCDFFDYAYPPDLTDPYKGAANEAWRERYELHHSKNSQRNWAKAGAFSLRYLKGLDKLHLIPGSRGLGIDASIGLEMACRFMERNPAIASYRDSLLGTNPKEAITFCGRVRRLHITGTKLLREYINSPIQGGGADILNHTIIRVCRISPEDIHYVYGVHDSFYFQFPVEKEAEYTPLIKAAVTAPYDIHGITVSLPVKWKVRYSTV